MRQNNLLFPKLILLSEFRGDFSAYFAAVYKIFQENFIREIPSYNNLKVSTQRHPEVDGIHRTFYHITHEGEIEKNRQPDIRRMERIRFPKFIIDNANHSEILIWKNNRGKDTRVVMFSRTENYIVVLTERKKYYLFWTAYLIEQEHRRRKLLKEYEAYIKTKTA